MYCACLLLIFSDTWANFHFVYFSESPAITEKNVDDILFDMFKNSDETVPVGKFLAVSKKYLEIF